MAEAYDERELTDEEYDEQGDEEAQKRAQLEALALELAELRTEAVKGRHDTGIEQDWLEDEEFYEGVDDVNRHEMGAYRSKPPGQMTMGGDGQDAGEGVSRGSTVFFNMTRSYCDAASARVADMLLPTDERGWAIKPTPIPELVEISEARLPHRMMDQIKAEAGDEQQAQVEMGRQTRERFPERIRDQVDHSFDDVEDPAEREQAMSKTYMDLAESVHKEVEAARAKADKAERRIEDWHVQCQYHAQMRQVIEDASRIGTGVLKGPIPTRKRQVAFNAEQGAIIIKEDLSPISVRVDPWNCFPDPACGENIHEGAYHWERADITPRRLAELAQQPGYMGDQIAACLEEGNYGATREWDPEAHGKGAMIGLARRERSKLYEIWYGYVHLTREQFECMDVELPEEMGEHPFIPMVVTMVNNRVIRATLNHLDTGDFPYDYMVWQRRADLPYGMGVARQGRTAQRVVNAAARNMMDNAGLSGGPMWAFLDDVLIPMDGIYEIRPRKGWAVNPEVLKEDPRLLEYAFQWFNMESNQQELQAILEIGLKMFEDVTGLPMLLQGQMGSAPYTVGGMQMLHNNASSIMRRIARLFDDLITEPHVRRYYTYLLQYGEDDEKGDFQIDARGSSALVERDINNQAIQMLGQFVINPQYGIDPKKWMEEFLKSQHLDVKKFNFDDEEWQQIVEGLAAQMQKGDSSVEVAQIRAQAMAMVQELKNQSDDKDRELEAAKLALQKEREDGKAVLDAAEKEQERQLRVAFEAIHREIDEIKIDSDERKTEKQIKADLAKFVAGLEAQFIMRGQDAEQSPELVTPPTEPAGRAPAGEAYER